MKKFWEQQEWLDKTKESNVDFYNTIINGKEIEMDWKTFSLIVDGVGHELKLSGGNSETKTKIEIINEDGSKDTFIRQMLPSYKIYSKLWYPKNLERIKKIKKINMKENIESGTEWIEDPVDLNLDIDKLRFESIEDLSIEEMNNQKVYDLEVENQHNYIVDGLGLVHNGGGK